MRELDEPDVMIDLDDGPDLAPTQVTIHQQAATGSLQSLATVAQSLPPRDNATLARIATDIGSRLGRAAFYSWKQGKKDDMIEGPTVKLAYALLGPYGRAMANVQIISVDGSRITLRGIAIDVQNVVCVERDYVFTLPPAPRGYAEKPDQMQRWQTMQIQSACSKAVRGAILALLPAWMVDIAVSAGRKAASSSILGGLELPAAIDRDVNAFRAEPPTGPGIGLDVLEARIGRPKGLWTIDDLETLRDDYRAMKSGQISIMAYRNGAMKPADTTPERLPPGIDTAVTQSTVTHPALTIEQRRAAAVQAMGVLGVAADVLAASVKAPVDAWESVHLTQLQADYQRLRAGGAQAVADYIAAATPKADGLDDAQLTAWGDTPAEPVLQPAEKPARRRGAP